jgi:hypothetical protein
MFPERRYIGYEFGSTTFATTARVTSPPRETSPPVSFGGREFPIEIPLHIECVAQFGEGVELAPLVRRLKSFPNKRAWSGLPSSRARAASGSRCDASSNRSRACVSRIRRRCSVLRARGRSSRMNVRREASAQRRCVPSSRSCQLRTSDRTTGRWGGVRAFARRPD